MLLVWYPKCTTCKRAEKFLTERGAKFETRHIKDARPSAEELAEWIKTSGLSARKFFNTSGLLYKELGLKAKLDSMNEAQQIALLASDGMLVKRPLLVGEGFVKVGFKEADWEEVL